MLLRIPTVYSDALNKVVLIVVFFLSLIISCPGINEVEEKYVSVYGKACTLVRFHQCFICRWGPHQNFTFFIENLFRFPRNCSHKSYQTLSSFRENALSPVLRLQMWSTTKFHFFHPKSFPYCCEIAHENMLNFAKFSGKLREILALGLISHKKG